ncbi:hypothetical protein [Nesterenkonia sp. NBAIMH1]|uniref:hypothetical protein n=1 Tax=Nesterenkonia sp. NBAIMH1 TaxID=2600320 RepID=UPI0011B8023C|nr:hypothetical protein [Nesterenkonia sp. NBAIMH1]
MILKIGLGLITILTVTAGIMSLMETEPGVTAGFAFGAAVVSAIGIAYLLGRDGNGRKKPAAGSAAAGDRPAKKL